MNAYENRFSKGANTQKRIIDVDDDIKQLIKPLKDRQDSFENDKKALLGCQHTKKSTLMKVNLFTYFFQNWRVSSINKKHICSS